MSKPKISIITVTLNAGDLLETAIQSLISQNYANLEFIIIDGGSTDNTVDVIKQYASYISYWHSKPDGGANQAYNMGVEHATGELVAFLNADDWYEPGILNKVAACYEKNPTDIITCTTRIVEYVVPAQAGTHSANATLAANSKMDSCLSRNDKFNQLALFQGPSATSMSLQNILFGNPLTNGRFYRRTLFQKVGFLKPHFDGKYFYSADREWFIRLALAQPTNAVIEDLGYTYLAHAGSITMSGSREAKQRGLIEHLRFMQDYLNSSILSTPDRHLFEWWYCDQALRLCYYYVVFGEMNKACYLLAEVLKQHPRKALSTIMKLPLMYARKYL